MASDRDSDRPAPADDENTPEDVPSDLAEAERAVAARPLAEGESEEDRANDALAPTEMGFQRFVYASFFGIGIGVAFLATKVTHGLWTSLGPWLAKNKIQLGDPRDEYVYPISAVIGLVVALTLFRKPNSRRYAEEVASELGKVTWPGKREVGNSTFIVVATTVIATLFFAILDGFWRWATDRIYGL
jgi:preprotein translocase subunit SecE